MMDMRKILLAGVLVGFLGPLSDANAATLANLWVRVGGGSCTRSAVPIAFNAATSCASMSAAYQVASQGDLILIKGGTYGGQTIPDRPTIGSLPVTFQVAETETVTVTGETRIQSHDIVLNGSDVLGSPSTRRFITQAFSTTHSAPGNRNILVEHIIVRDPVPGSFAGVLVYIDADQTTIRHSRIGPRDGCVGGQENDMINVWVRDFSGNPTVNVTFEYNELGENDERACSGDGSHRDMLVCLGCTNFVLRGNRIWWCATQCFHPDKGDWANLPMGHDVLIENNMFEVTNSALCPRCGASGQIGVWGTNFNFRYNTLQRMPNPTTPGAGQTTFLVGNLLLDPTSSCDGNAATYAFNVFPSTGSTCGSNARRGTPRLANGSLYSAPPNGTTAQADWHLSPTDTVAAGAGNPSAFPSIDLDRRVRVSPPSAGAIQVGAIGGGTSPTSPTGLGLSRAVEEPPIGPATTMTWVPALAALPVAQLRRETRRPGRVRVPG